MAQRFRNYIVNRRKNVLNEKYALWEDKYRSRRIVEDLHVQLPGLIAVADTVDRIDFTALTDKYVIKPNHWAASEGVFCMCDGINLITGHRTDICSIKQKIRTLLRKTFTYEKSQSLIERKVIVEELLRNEDGLFRPLTDYKMFVFGGETRFIQVIQDRDIGYSCIFMTPEWKPSPRRMTVFKYPRKPPPRPIHLEAMMKDAETLQKAFGEFLRVDMYATDRGAVFGEFTHAPASGEHFTDYGNTVLGELFNQFG